MYLICFYVPATHVDAVKNAMFQAGAGKVGHYSHCAWQTLGEGQFMPLAESRAFIGEVGLLEKVAEYKVEMVCETAHLNKVIAALTCAHPYETPAYHVMALQDEHPH
ncbi:MAG: NGG1p interacting factor NIF3 [Gammaproteobacteria bacterium RIFCSPHIGHO2_12_FULL_45_12]|nr:MAG: NGG1p interacting factor NIF3 [Gammaproteobacteria bacterium RIFCSPHIGHO2_12_FULL_45_12]